MAAVGVTTTSPVGQPSATVQPPAVTTTAPAPAVTTSPTSSTSHTTTSAVHSSSSSSSPPSQSQSGSGANVNNAANGPNHGGSVNNNLKVIIPIATVACVLVIIYILYRIYLLHKGRKEQVTPLPPPRTPAIFEQRRPQSMMMMYGHSQPMMATPPSYRQSMRPASFIYDGASARQSNSSLSKVPYPVSGSGNTTPSDATMERPFRGSSARPHSVASFGSLNGSARGSMYAPPLRNSPHGSLRGDVILPAPLSSSQNAGMMHLSHSHPPITGRGSRYSMFNAPTMNEYAQIRPSSSAELRASDSSSEMRPARPMSAMAHPSHSNRAASWTLPSAQRTGDDWTERIAVAEVESNSTCTQHHADRPASPPPPLPVNPVNPNSTLPVPTPTDARTPSPQPSRAVSSRDPSPTANAPSSFSGHIPGAFPPSPSPSLRGRSASPPEQLLTGAFVSASESAESK